MITATARTSRESTFAAAFAAGDVRLARGLYHPAVVYLSPTVRLFGWPPRIEGVERVLEFIYRGGRIGQQDLYDDPDGTLEELGPC
jgi:hypothetical protein